MRISCIFCTFPHVIPENSIYTKTRGKIRSKPYFLFNLFIKRYLFLYNKRRQQSTTVLLGSTADGPTKRLCTLEYLLKSWLLAVKSPVQSLDYRANSYHIHLNNLEFHGYGKEISQKYPYSFFCILFVPFTAVLRIPFTAVLRILVDPHA